jgi:DNA topoisomerase IA
MLTQEDLEQLRAVVRDEVRGETAVMKRDVNKVQVAVLSVKEDVRRLTGDTLVLKEDIQRLEQKIDRIERNQAQDGEVLGEISAKLMEVVEDHEARIKRLEDPTGLSHS